MSMAHELLPTFTLILNGKRIERAKVRADDILVDFLHEELGLTGTKFSCGIGACGACKVALQETSDGPMIPVLACYARLKAINGMHITTVEGLGTSEKLHPLQAAFLEEHSFQCGFSTPGFLMAGRILLEDLQRTPVHADRLDEVILEAIGGHICRCTGYVRYFKAIRRVILETPGLVLGGATPAIIETPSLVSFQIVKKSTNDLAPETLVGRFDNPKGEIEFVDALDWAACRGAWISVNPTDVHTGVRVRDLNLQQFFFIHPEVDGGADSSLRFVLSSAHEIDTRQPLSAAAWGVPVPVHFRGVLSFGGAKVPVAVDILARLLSQSRMRLTSQRPLELDMHLLGVPLQEFSSEFGLIIGPIVSIGIDVTMDYKVV